MVSIRRGAFYSAVSMAANFGLPLALLPFLTRALGSKGFGEFAIAQAIAIVFCQIVDFGFTLVGARNVAIVQNDEELVSLLYSRIQSARFLLALASLSLLAVLVMYNPLPINGYVLALAASPAIIGTLFQSVWFFQGSGLFGWLALSNLISKAAYFALVVSFVNGINDLNSAAMFFGLSYCIGALVLVAALLKKGIRWRGCATYSELLNTLLEAVRPFLSLAFLSIHMQILVAVVGALNGPSMAGVLSAADRVVRGVSAVSVPFANALFPVFSRLYSLKDSSAIKLRRKTVAALLAVGFFGTVVLYTQAHLIASLLLPEAIRDLVTALRILSVVPVAVVVGVVFGGLTLVPAGFDKDYFTAIILAEIIGGVAFWILFVFDNSMIGSWVILVTEIALGGLMFVFVNIRMGFQKIN